METLLLSALFGLIIAGVSAPYETLGWWAGWYGDEPGKVEVPGPLTPSAAGHFVVYLSGIGVSSAEAYSPLERRFLRELKKELESAELVTDVFPYSSRNHALTGQRMFAWLWRRLDRLRGRGRLSALSFLINLRNFWQVLVSSDARFGPLYNYASSELIYATLLAHGYRVGSGVPVTLIGYSGGGQIALGAAGPLKHALRAPVHIVSLGGVMSSNEEVLELDSLTHLYGAKDGTQRLGYIMFPQRWPVMVHTPWNRARQRGIIRRVPMGPVGHTGRGGYLDPKTRLDSGESFLEQTLRTVVSLIEGAERGERF